MKEFRYDSNTRTATCLIGGREVTASRCTRTQAIKLFQGLARSVDTRGLLYSAPVDAEVTAVRR